MTKLSITIEKLSDVPAQVGRRGMALTRQEAQKLKDRGSYMIPDNISEWLRDGAGNLYAVAYFAGNHRIVPSEAIEGARAYAIGTAHERALNSVMLALEKIGLDPMKNIDHLVYGHKFCHDLTFVTFTNLNAWQNHEIFLAFNRHGDLVRDFATRDSERFSHAVENYVMQSPEVVKNGSYTEAINDTERAFRLAVHAVVRNESYDTPAWGIIWKYSGEGEIKWRDEVWKVEGYGPKGDGAWVSSQGYIKCVSASGMTRRI